MICVHTNAADITITGKVSDADLDLSINLLRSGGKITTLTNAFVTTNDLDMRDELHSESCIELAQEGHRYSYLMRWKTAKIKLPKPVLGNFFFKT